MATPSISAEQIPSLIIPRPWTSAHTTNAPGCLRNLSLVVSLSDEGRATVKQSIDTKAALERLKGVNKLQKQSWHINQSVLAVLKDYGRSDLDNAKSDA